MFRAIDVATGRSVLYQPRLDEDYAIIMGHIPSPEEVRDRYRVDEVETGGEAPCIYNSLLRCDTLTRCLTTSAPSPR